MAYYPLQHGGSNKIMGVSPWLLLWLVLLALSSQLTVSALKLGMTSGGSSFFDPIQEGWEESCTKQGIHCEYLAENWTYFLEHYNQTTELVPCVPQIRYFIEQQFDGIAIQCGVDHPVIQQALDAGIKLVAFDVPPPAPYAAHIPYVGTDNYYLGVTMARLLRLLKPQGGTYHVVSFQRIPQRYQGFVAEIEKDNLRQDRAHWHKVTTNYSGLPEGDNLTVGMELHHIDSLSYEAYQNLERLAALNPTAIVFMYQTPMRHENYTQFVENNRHRDIALIGTQGSNDELEYMARRYVDGLVGQVTYDMGRLSLETLLFQLDNISVNPVTYTKLINYHLVPERLPPVQVDQSLLGNLQYVGYTFFVLVTICVVNCMGWSLWYRRGIVVRASQPLFLGMVAIGVWILSAALVPLSMDDDGKYPDISEAYARGICMSVPWLAFVGFSIVFAALFAKTWRVNQFFHSRHRFQRIRISEKDVFLPLLVVLSLNIVVLLCWTLIDPLTYIREFEDGTDLYNREIASNGYCRSDHAAAYLVPLALINLGVLVVACLQAYVARGIKSEFAEAKYIGLSVFGMCQAFVAGIPIVAVVKDIPQAYYLVLTCLIFLLSMMILLLIFLPKMWMQHQYGHMSEEEQRKALAVSVRHSTRPRNSSRRDENINGSSLLALESTDKQGTSRQFEAECATRYNRQKPPSNECDNNHQGGEDPEEQQSSLENDRPSASLKFGSLVEKIEEGDAPLKGSTYAEEEDMNGEEMKDQ